MANLPTGQWWLIYGSGQQTGRGAVPVNAHAVYMAHGADDASQQFLAAHPGFHVTNVFGPFTSMTQANQNTANRATTGTHVNPHPKNNFNIPNPIDSWLKGLGGAIGAGLESAAVAFLNDLWDVIVGPLEILAGVLLAMFILVFAFRNELMSIAPLIAAMA